MLLIRTYSLLAFSHELRTSASFLAKWKLLNRPISDTFVGGGNGLIRKLSTEEKKTNQDGMNAKFIEDDIRMPIRKRLKNMIILYGPLATVLHISLSLTFLGVTYLLVNFGLDATGILSEYAPLKESTGLIIAHGGKFGLAYALYKMMMPLRIMVTLFLTPKVANKLHSIGLIKKNF